MGREHQVCTWYLVCTRHATPINRSLEGKESKNRSKKRGTPYSYDAKFLFCFPFIILALLFSLPPSRNSDPGSHCRLFSTLPTTVRALHFYPEKASAFLLWSTRVELPPTHARCSHQLILYFCKINSKSHRGGIRTPGQAPLLINHRPGRPVYVRATDIISYEVYLKKK